MKLISLKTLWDNFKGIWESLHEALDVPRREEISWWRWITSQFFIVLIVILVVLLHFSEFIQSWKEDWKTMFKECCICKEGYDISTLHYPMVTYFCPQCVKDVGEDGLNLISKFREWAVKQTDSNGCVISDKDVLGIILSAFYAIKNKAQRGPLFDALSKYTSGNVGDTLTLAELLEELSLIQEGKKK